VIKKSIDFCEVGNMTINIGINLGEYIILGADTRTERLLGNRKMFYSDEDQKIQETKIGLITGAGYKDILDDVKRELSQRDTENTTEIIQIVKKSKDKFLINRPPFFTVDEKWFEPTCWLLTYMTIIDKFPGLRLALIHPQFNHDIALYEKYMPCVVMPRDSTPEELEFIAEFVNGKIKPLEDISKIEENIIYHVGLIQKVIRDVSEKHDSVSQSFQIGVHVIDGSIGISPIIKANRFSINFHRG